MSPKYVLPATAFLVLAAMVFAPAANGNADVIAVSATAGNFEQTWPVWLVNTHEIEPTEASGQILLPLIDEIDQNQPSATTYMAGFNQDDLAQSFMQTNSNISGAGIFLQPGIGSSDNVTIQLWDALPNAGGTMIVEASATGTQDSWVDVFWTAVPIPPATTYYLVFTGNTTLGIAGDTGNPYPDGNVFANTGYGPFPNFDYTFRTYYDTEVALERHTWANVKSLF